MSEDYFQGVYAAQHRRFRTPEGAFEHQLAVEERAATRAQLVGETDQPVEEALESKFGPLHIEIPGPREGQPDPRVIRTGVESDTPSIRARAESFASPSPEVQAELRAKVEESRRAATRQVFEDAYAATLGGGFQVDLEDTPWAVGAITQVAGGIEDALTALADLPKVLGLAEEQLDRMGREITVDPVIPEIEDSISQGLVRDFSQFLVGFIPLVRGAQALQIGAKLGSTSLGGQALIEGAIASVPADFALMKGGEGNIADILPALGVEEEGLVDWLTTAGDHDVLEARIKNAILNSVFGAGLELTLRGSVAGSKAAVAWAKTRDPQALQRTADFIWQAVKRMRDLDVMARIEAGRPQGPLARQRGAFSTEEFRRPKKSGARTTDDIEQTSPEGRPPAPSGAPVNPIDPGLSQEQKAARLHQMSRTNQKFLEPVLDAVRQATGLSAEEVFSGIKTKESLIAKANRPGILDKKPWFNVEYVRDSFRFKVAFDHPDQAEAALRALFRAAPDIEVIEADRDKFFVDNPWGWRVLPFDLRMPNGQIAEFYMTPIDLQQALDGEFLGQRVGNHELFEKWRYRDLRNLTSEEQADFVADAAESKQFYDAAYDSWLQRLGLDEASAKTSLDSASDFADSLVNSSVTDSPVSDSVQSSARVQGPSGDLSQMDASSPGSGSARSRPSSASKTLIQTSKSSISRGKQLLKESPPNINARREPKRTIALDEDSAPKLATQVLKERIALEAPGGGSPSVVDAFDWLDRQMLAKNGGRVLDPGNAQDLSLMRRRGIREVAAQLQEPVTGATWYDEMIVNAFDISGTALPRLASDPDFRRLSTVFTAVTSPQSVAVNNWVDGMRLAQLFDENGAISSMRPSGKNWGLLAAKQQLDMLQNMIDDMDIEGAMEWVMTPHPIRELREMRRANGYKTDSGVTGKAADMQLGSYIFGPKVGAFIANLNGFDLDTTVDLWLTRSYNRHIGRLRDMPTSGDTGQSVPRNEAEREIIKKWTASLGEPFGLSNKQAQAVLWYFEQRLYRQLGTSGAASTSFEDGARRYIALRDAGTLFSD